MKHYLVMLVLLPVSLWAMDEQEKREKQRERDRQRGVTMRFHEDMVDSEQRRLDATLHALGVGAGACAASVGFDYLRDPNQFQSARGVANSLSAGYLFGCAAGLIAYYRERRRQLNMITYQEVEPYVRDLLGHDADEDSIRRETDRVLAEIRR